MTFTTIQQVLDRLDAIILDAEINASRQGYFAVLYRSMTFAVLQGTQNTAFGDTERMTRLDTNFATRYIEAYDAYRLGQPVSKGWKTAFDACERKDITVIQHLLLGINTHINLDLAIASAVTCPGPEAIMGLQKDYDHINDVIGSLVDGVQEKLGRVWWPLRLLRKITNNRQDAVINFSIDTARKAAWANAVALASVTGDPAKKYIDDMDIMVAALGNGIIRPGFPVNLLLRFVRLWEYKDVKRIIQLIK